MLLSHCKIPGVFLVEPKVHRDERGAFSEIFNKGRLAESGISFHVEQVNVSLSLQAGTVRGMHYQEEPHAQQKLVRCLSGEIFDVVVDLRPDSKTYRKHVGFKLFGRDYASVYVPVGCAHGYQALKDHSEIEYLVSAPWNKAAERGVHPEDPLVGVKWPLPVIHLNPRDASWPPLG